LRRNTDLQKTGRLGPFWAVWGVSSSTATRWPFGAVWAANVDTRGTGPVPGSMTRGSCRIRGSTARVCLGVPAGVRCLSIRPICLSVLRRRSPRSGIVRPPDIRRRSSSPGARPSLESETRCPGRSLGRLRRVAS